MRTLVHGCVNRSPLGRPPQDEVLTEQASLERFAADLPRVPNRVPVISKRRHLTDEHVTLPSISPSDTTRVEEATRVASFRKADVSPGKLRPCAGQLRVDDVARLAGVSTAVVSYVLNDGPRPVAAGTRARVLGAIEDLRYRPNAIARALRSRRSGALGLIVSDIGNPFIGELASSIESAAFESGYTVLLGNTMVEAERQRRYLRHFVDRQVDGLLIVPVANIDAVTVDELNSGTAPVVVLDRPMRRSRGAPTLRATTLLADNVAGGRLVTEHLIEHGHRKIGCLAGPRMMPPSTGRLKGWSQAIAGSSLASSGCHVVRASVNRRSGYEAAMELIGGSGRPTAVFASSDEQAIGVLRAAAELGLRVPQISPWPALTVSRKAPSALRGSRPPANL